MTAIKLVFEPYDTGGGCTALRADFGTGEGYCLITSHDDASIPTPDERVLLGIYEGPNYETALFIDEFSDTETAKGFAAEWISDAMNGGMF